MAGQRPLLRTLIKAAYQNSAVCFLDLRVATLIAIFVQFGTGLVTSSMLDPESGYGMVAIALQEVIGAAALSPYAVLIHRRIILQDAAHDYMRVAGSRRAIRFVGASLLFVAASVIEDGVGRLDRLSGWFVLPTLAWAIATLIATFRLSLVFPMIAVDGSDTPFADSFRITRGSAWWIAWAFVLGFGPLIAVGVGIYVLQAGLTGGLWAATIAGDAVLNAFGYALGVALASQLYITRKDWARTLAAGES